MFRRPGLRRALAWLWWDCVRAGVQLSGRRALSLAGDALRRGHELAARLALGPRETSSSARGSRLAVVSCEGVAALGARGSPGAPGMNRTWSSVWDKDLTFLSSWNL